MHIYEKRKLNPYFEDVNKNISQIFIRRMDAVVNNLWDAINGKGDGNYLFRMIAMPRIDIAASDCMTDEADLEKHIMDDSFIEPLNCLFISLIPNDDKLLLLLGCDSRHDKGEKYKNIVMSFPTGDVPYSHYIDTLKGVLLKCSNWCCAPKLYIENDWRAFFDEYEELKVKSSFLA